MPRKLMLLVLCVLCAAPEAAQHRVFVVNADDDDPGRGCTPYRCNLRAAIHAANLTRGTIRFDLPGFPYRITLRKPLPALHNHVTIDGSTQKGAECPLPVVHIDGAQLGRDSDANGLTIRGRGNLVRGIVVTGFPNHGIVVDGDENTVQCSFVGVDPTGTQAQGNGGHGIGVIGGHSNRIGGPQVDDMNLLSANAGRGLYIEDAINTYVHNNAIGVDVLGNEKLPNGDAALADVNPPAGVSPIRNPRLRARVVALLERRVARIINSLEPTLVDSGIFEKYVKLAPSDVPPKSLQELIVVLTRHPEAYAAFTNDAAAILAQRRSESATEFARLAAIAQRLVPSFGRDAAAEPPDSRDGTLDLLARFSPDDYVISKQPSDIIAVLDKDGPIVPLNQIFWHSLYTYGPFGFNTQLSNIQYVRECQNLASPCFWPIAYDLYPISTQLLWQSLSLSQQQMQDVVEQDGYQVELRLNGQLLGGGPHPGSLDQLPAAQSYYAATIPAAPCPAGRTCFATEVFVRGRIANIPQPWTFELTVKQLTELDAPQIIDVGPNGELIIATHKYVEIAKSTRTVQPNPEFVGQKWFTEALYDTFQHPRCSDCHGFEDFDGLAQHHGYANTDSFVQSVNLHLEASLYVPGKHVMACNSCHIVPNQDNHGNPFHELEWIAPYFDLDVNWAQKNPQQTCSRVKSNLPTKELRYEHFHGDGRLFWAIEYPIVPGQFLEKAPPQDFDEFLRRIDLWNFFGAPCP